MFESSYAEKTLKNAWVLGEYPNHHIISETRSTTTTLKKWCLCRAGQVKQWNRVLGFESPSQ